MIVLGFEEYLSLNEYNALRIFALNGGKLIILCGGSFLVRVSYNPHANRVALVQGHGWRLNGTVAFKSVYNRWYKENNDWVGSNYAYYIDSQHHFVSGAIANTTDPYSKLLQLVYGEHVFSSYGGHEENIVTNSSDSIIAYWSLIGGKNLRGVVATYELNVGRGTVFHMGVFGVDFLMQSKQMQFFLLSFLGLSSVNITISYRPCARSFAVQIGTPGMIKNFKTVIQLEGILYSMQQSNASTFIYEVRSCVQHDSKFTVFIFVPDLFGTFINRTIV